MTTSCTDTDHPYYKELSRKRTLKEIYKFFIRNDAKRMKFVSLGEALDFISAGGGNCVGYGYSSKGLIKFIKTWIEAQEPRIDYDRIELDGGSHTYKEKSREHFYLWNKFHQQAKELPELPFIKFDSCPLDKEHKKIILDRGDRVRCAHQENFEIHPSFTKVSLVRGLATGTKKIDFFENPPYDDSDFDEEYNEFLVRKHKFDNEEPIQVTDTCYSIIKEPKSFYLPLETILDRINCSTIKGQTVHPFSGFTLADYVHAWWEQSGEKKYWKHDNSISIYKEFPNFTPIGTDD